MYAYVQNLLLFRFADAIHLLKFSHRDGHYLYFEVDGGRVIGYPARQVEVLYVTPTQADGQRFADEQQLRISPPLVHGPPGQETAGVTEKDSCHD